MKTMTNWWILKIVILILMVANVISIFSHTGSKSLYEMLLYEQKIWATVAHRATGDYDILHMPFDELAVILGDTSTESNSVTETPGDWVYRVTFTSAYDGCRKKSTVLTPIPSDAETYIIYIGTDYILYEDRLVENTDTTSLITSIDMLVSTEVGHAE